ncbi:unnamed protein product [Peronospora belbahrii]|uniref:TAZ-type domain-containing protein n=1 Tax=Peronospora belbahrii TaxID=622444 RepID=A0AAU9L077_9STRA|nr:unnamed protein product [Peronospora belbahrii]
MVETARLLVDFEREQEQTVVPDLKMYERCCKQLITFMAKHMQTSQGFIQQMDQVIQESYKNSRRLELGLTQVEDLWLYYGKHNAQARTAPWDTQPLVMPQTPSSGLEPTVKVDNRTLKIGMDVTSLVVTNSNDIGLRPTCSPNVDLSESTPSTVRRGEKRQVKRGRLMPRAGHSVARNLYSVGSLDCTNEDDMGLECAKDLGTEIETGSEVLVESCKVPSDQHVGILHALSDQVVWPCAGDNPLDRNPAFIEHLKLAVALVDAKNCSPPPGTKCMQSCKSLRDRMCQSHRIQGGNARVCHDKMCSVWRNIDTHLVRCQNSDCEFKNSVGLRQAMHDILQTELKLKATSDKLLVAKSTLSATGGIQNDRPGTSASHIESEITRLEEKCTKLEDIVLFHQDRQRAFELDLNALQIPPAKCESENVPSFQSHYARKRSRE